MILLFLALLWHCFGDFTVSGKPCAGPGEPEDPEDPEEPEVTGEPDVINEPDMTRDGAGEVTLGTGEGQEGKQEQGLVRRGRYRK